MSGLGTRHFEPESEVRHAEFSRTDRSSWRTRDGSLALVISLGPLFDPCSIARSIVIYPSIAAKAK